MHYQLISFTHKNTDIHIREKLTFENDDTLKAHYETLLSYPTINEAIIFSTCNRTELFLSVNEFGEQLEFIFKQLSLLSGVEPDVLNGIADVYEDHGAIHHLFSVVSSLDSIVVGETQIAGQIKDAFKFSFDNGYSSQKLIRAMHFAFRCSSAVRSSTDISKSPISISSVAVAKAKDILGALGGFTAVVIGAGEMARLAAKHLIASGVNVIIINRSEQKAKELCEELGSMSDHKPIESLEEYLNRYRLLFSATGAKDPIITKEMIEPKEFHRYWFDIAIPRDIEEIKDEKIDLFTVDDLQDIVDTNKSLREEQSTKAYGIVGSMTNEFFKWLNSLSFEPIIKELREQARDAAQKELERSIKKGFVPAEHEKSIEKILHQAFNTFLHTPTNKLKEVAELPESDTIVESVKYLFDIEAEKKMMNMYNCDYHMDTELVHIEKCPHNKEKK
jgi:glutamyl-tRNA reductase